jgi:ABC-type multidrug transport system ATPase subunit
VFGLLGPHGSGKSTLLRIIATLQVPDDGTVTLGHIDVIRQKDEARKTLGYLPQDLGLFPRISAENLLDYLALMKGIIERRTRREVVEALLQRRRSDVALALLGNPKLIIVDEPTATLDPAERIHFLNLLSELGESRVVLLATRSIADVSEYCTRMAIIDRGEILFEAEPQGAVDELRGRIWRGVISRDELAGLERRHTIISTRLFAGRTIARVLGDASPGPGFEATEPDLEDVYFGTLAGHIGRPRRQLTTRRSGIVLGMGRLRRPLGGIGSLDRYP